MGTSSPMNTTNQYIKYTITVTEKSQDIADNCTLVNVSVRFYRTNTGYQTYGTGTLHVKVNGQSYTATLGSEHVITESGIVLFNKNFWIDHNDDGTKTLTCSAWMEHSQFSSTEQSYSQKLTTIARASQPSCITWPEHTQDVGEFGDTISIHMNRKSSSFTHTVRYEFGSASGTIATGVGTGTTWEIPKSLIELIPANVSGSGRIYVDTYNGSTKVGTKYCGFTATVPANIKPEVNLHLEDVNNIDDIYGSPVQGLSQIKVSVSGFTEYGSPIVSYTISANGTNYTTNPSTTGLLKSSGTSRVTATATDKRGRTGSVHYDMDVQAYTAPTVSKLSVNRCDANGNSTMQGGYIKATFSANITSLNNKNTATYKLRYKKTTDSTWTEVALSSLNNTYTLTNQAIAPFSADTGSSYDVEVVATDRHSSTTRATSASTAFALMHFNESGKGIGLLKVSEKADGLDIGGDIHLNNHRMFGSQGILDTRDTNETPEWYMAHHPKGVVWEFKKLTSIQFTAPTHTFGPLQTIVPWNDSSGSMPRQVAYEGKKKWSRIATSTTTWGAWETEALSAYPIGSIYIAYNHTDPSTLFGGTWVRMTDGFLWASRETDTIGQTGGEKTHALTLHEMPEHKHSINVANTASGSLTANNAIRYNSSATSYNGTVYTNYEGGNDPANPHNNMPPYIQVSIWRRTA